MTSWPTSCNITELVHLFGDPIEQGPLVGQPHVLEGVHLAAGHISVGRVEIIMRADLDGLVTELILEDNLRQVGDRHVLVPTYVGEQEHIVLPEAAAARQGEGAQHEREDRSQKFAARLRRRSLLQFGCIS
jgi:hypothetical protein